MARADLILSIVKSGASGDQAQLRRTVEALAAEERAKRHTLLADRLLAHLRSGSNGRYQSSIRPGMNVPIEAMLFDLTPRKRLADLILPIHVGEVVRDLIEEQHRTDLLRSYGLEPRHRVLLSGPPGNGKTSLAEAIADALQVEFLVARYDGIIGSYLGETAQRLDAVFEHARSRKSVLFFDEFDVIGKERGDPQDTGEIKRVVSSVLLQVDSLPSHVVVVIASNHPELLDRAVWRRFQVQVELPFPKQAQIAEWFKRFEDRTGRSIGISPRSLGRKLQGLSFAEIEHFGNDVLRRSILGQDSEPATKIVETQLGHWKQRGVVKQQCETTSRWNDA